MFCHQKGDFLWFVAPSIHKLREARRCSTDSLFRHQLGFLRVGNSFDVRSMVQPKCIQSCPPTIGKKPQINVTIDKQLCVWIFLCFIDVSSSSIWTRKTCVAHVDGTSHSVSCSAIPQWARRFPKLSALTIRNWHPCFSFFWNAWEEWSLAKRTQQFCLSVGFSNIISMEFNQLFPQVTCLSKSTLFNVSFSQEIMNVYPGVVLPLAFPVCQGIHNVPMFFSYFFPKKFQVPDVLFLNSSLWLQGKSQNVIPRLSHEIPMES